MVSPFFLTTIPKSGTHLVTQFLKLSGLQRHGFGERELVRDIERLFFHRRHTSAYRRAHGIEIGRRTLPEAEQTFARSLAAAGDELRATPEDFYAFHHVPYEPRLVGLLREVGLPMVFLHRDPRDVAISMTHHIMRRPDGRKSETLAALPSDEARYAAVIEGLYGRRAPHFPLLPLSMLFERYEGWLRESDVLVLRYEDVIGPRGGGDLDRQYGAYRRLAGHIGLGLTEAELRERVDTIYSEAAPYFVAGRIGQWREKSTPRVAQAFRQSLGRTIRRWSEAGAECERSWLWGFRALARRRLRAS